ncbi:MBL fold metallo-hydrolase [Streptosporangium sp. NPDC020072]|uniref:MBL fold metallo-hydrolase n=1 Tax=Streptosporangium jomthongense TaxID=1193683 RepID=A0ABV8ERU8_9ACTN
MKSLRRPYSEQRPTDIGGGVWSVPVPIPGNPLGYTLIYAIESPAGPVLVDAGWNHPDAWLALRDGLAATGMDIREVRGVVVTHFHADHAGLAGQVRQESGAWIAMHEADAELVGTMREAEEDAQRTERAGMLRRAGAGAAEIEAVTTAYRPEPPAAPDRTLRDGDMIDIPGRRLRTVWTPGHTPGHVCLHLEDADRLFTGDHVLPGITPHIGVYPYDRTDMDPLGDFLASLEKVAELGPLEALPAHEWIFQDTAERARAIGAHHEEKLTSLVALLAEAGEPLTIWEIASRMTWKRSWDDLPSMLRGMAAAEAAAHLRALEVRGRVRRTAEGDPKEDMVRFTVHS